MDILHRAEVIPWNEIRGTVSFTLLVADFQFHLLTLFCYLHKYKPTYIYGYLRLKCRLNTLNLPFKDTTCTLVCRLTLCGIWTLSNLKVGHRSQSIKHIHSSVSIKQYISQHCAILGTALCLWRNHWPLVTYQQVAFHPQECL